MAIKEPIRVLQVLPALNFCGGIENYVMNYYRHIDRTKIQFDFVTHTDLECSYKEEILSLGGRIFALPLFRMASLPKILSEIDTIFAREGSKYSAVHCHMANAACFYFWKARKYGIKNLILHSHNSASAGVLSHIIRNYPLLKLGNMLATQRMACSKLAGEFLFGGAPYKQINNAIEVDKFAFDEATRDVLRKKWDWGKKIIIGHIGRMAPPKNQSFLLDIFYELVRMDDSYRLVMIGQGEDESDIRKKAHLLGITDHIDILPPTPDVADYYQAFDAFVFPSLYEGLGIVLIEAQCSGLPTYSSKDNVPTDVNLTEDFHFLQLSQSPKEWADIVHSTIRCKRESQVSYVRKAGYDISKEVTKLEDIYLSKTN